jgi:hypothetical protein
VIKAAPDLATQPGPIGLIRADECYRLSEFQKRLHLGPHAVRRLRRQGLRVHRVGRVSFVLGSDFIRHLEAVANASADRGGP